MPHTEQGPPKPDVHPLYDIGTALLSCWACKAPWAFPQFKLGVDDSTCWKIEGVSRKIGMHGEGGEEEWGGTQVQEAGLGFKSPFS